MKIILVVFFAAISVNSYSQNIANIDSIHSKYSRIIQGLQRKEIDEIKTLPLANYAVNKSRINKKYNSLIDNLIVQRDQEIFKIQKEIEKAAEINLKKQLTEQESEEKARAQEEKLQKIESEKQEIESQKKEAEEFQKRQVLIAKKNRELEVARVAHQKQQEFDKSDYGKIQISTKTEFLAWREKTQFENQEEYMKRVQNYSAKFNEIYSTEISKSKEAFLKRRLYRVPVENLSEYDVENETYILATMKDTFSFKVPKTIVEVFKSNLNEIAILPKDFIMVNNNWKCSKAFIITNNRLAYGIYLDDLISIQELPNGELLFRCQDSQYDKYKLKNLRKCNKYEDGIYYYSWDISQEKALSNISSQDMKLSIEEIGIKTPSNK